MLGLCKAGDRVASGYDPRDYTNVGTLVMRTQYMRKISGKRTSGTFMNVISDFPNYVCKGSLSNLLPRSMVSKTRAHDYQIRIAWSNPDTASSMTT